MIHCEMDRVRGQGLIVIRPNRSSSWRQSVWFFGALAGLCLLIALGFGLRGLWWVLPFAGLEVLVLFASVYWVFIKSEREQRLLFKGDSVELEDAEGRSRQYYVLTQREAYVRIEKAEHYGHIPKISLHDADNDLVIAGFLGEEELDRLIQALEAVVPVYGARPLADRRDFWG